MNICLNCKSCKNYKQGFVEHSFCTKLEWSPNTYGKVTGNIIEWVCYFSNKGITTFSIVTNYVDCYSARKYLMDDSPDCPMFEERPKEKTLMQKIFGFLK